MAQSQQERKAETRTRLLVAAADLFAEQGIDAVSVDAVAEAAGRTSGAVYAHFGSKHGLLLALLDWWKETALTVLFAEVAMADDPVRQLGAVWATVGAADDDTAARWSLLEHELWLRAARDPEVAAPLRSRQTEALGRSARELERWTARTGATPAAPPDQLAVLMKALLTGLEMQHRLDPDTVDPDTAVAGFAALLGLGGPTHNNRTTRTTRTTRTNGTNGTTRTTRTNRHR